jgi:hypothetical protein
MLISLGRFAAFGPVETLFTNTFARMGLDMSWGVIMIVIGIGNIAAVFMLNRTATVVVYGITSITLLWTWFLAYFIGVVYTPTVESCLWVGIALFIGAAYEATISKKIRCVRKEKLRNGDPSN